MPPQIGQGPTVIQEYFRSIDSAGQEVVPASPARSNGTMTPDGRSTGNELKTVLAVIFKKIGDKKKTQEGIECLYQFQQDHPDVDVKPFLANTSAAFRAYIEKGLRIISEKRKPSETDPMEVDEVEPIEEMKINWQESPDGHYLPTDDRHQSVNS